MIWNHDREFVVAHALAPFAAHNDPATFHLEPAHSELSQVRSGFDRVGVETTLRPDRQDSQKGLKAAVRVCHPRGCLVSVPIGGFVGDHPSDATTGVFDVSVVSGNEVDVGVGDGLAGCLVGVDADVEPVGVEVFDK